MIISTQLISKIEFKYSWDDFIGLLKGIYLKVNPEQTLKFFSVSDPLHKYTTTLKDRKYGIIKLPSKICRRYSLELAGAVQEEESKTPVAVSSKDPDDIEDVADENVFAYVEETDWWNSWESFTGPD